MSQKPDQPGPSQSVLILGRQPELGLAELEALHGADKLQPAGSSAAILGIDPSAVNFRRLGGSTRLARLLARLDGADWPKAEKHLRDRLPQLASQLPEGKLKLGLSAYGFDGKLTPAKLNASGLSLKKAIKSSGRSVRLVPNTTLELNTASVLHNGLTSPTGCELLIIRDNTKNTTLLAQTVAVQDIEAYAARDQARPKRDARVGMLPPKLAQIIINLAAANRPVLGLLDPFCGTGVVLQEALLMGLEASGSDLEPRMVDYSRHNIDWLQQAISYNGRLISLEVGDATTHQWPSDIDTVAGETYLGQPFATIPPPEKLEQVRSDTNLILKKFLRNIHPQLPAGARLCLAVPAWQTSPGQFKHLPLIDQISELGYNRVSFERIREQQLLYYRQDQVVARELLVLTKQ